MTYEQILQAAKRFAKKNNTKWKVIGRNIRLETGKPYCPLQAAREEIGKTNCIYWYGNTFNYKGKIRNIMYAADGYNITSPNIRRMRGEMKRILEVK